MKTNIQLVSLFLLLFSFSTYATAQNVSEEARRHLMREQAAIEVAKNDADLEEAFNEFKLAANLAPQWGKFLISWLCFKTDLKEMKKPFTT